MDSPRLQPCRRPPRARKSERSFNQWLSTGRQLMNGVAGTRPGQHHSMSSERPTLFKLESVGRWLGERLEWLFDEEDSWHEPWQRDKTIMAHHSNTEKRPLKAISRRRASESQPRSSVNAGVAHSAITGSVSDQPENASSCPEYWPSSDKGIFWAGPEQQYRRQQPLESQRLLPRSSRRRA